MSRRPSCHPSLCIWKLYLTNVIPCCTHPAPQEAHPLALALDRLTVQLFNSDDVTVRLVAESRLLECFTACMAQQLQRWAEAGDASTGMSKPQLRSACRLVPSFWVVAVIVNKRGCQTFGL